MSKLQIIPISEPVEIATRLYWDEETQSVYFVDVPKSTVYKYDNNTGEMTHANVGDEPLAFMYPVEGSSTKFIAGLGRRFVYVEWDGISDKVTNVQTILEIEKDAASKLNRINGAKVDPFGRLWAGTMGPMDSQGQIVPGKGALYSLEKGVLKKHESNIGCSNGLAWNTKQMKMYYVDTLAPYVYQYDVSTEGILSNKTKVFDMKENKIDGKPDGLTIDSNGNLWLCCIYGSLLVKFDPNSGKILRKIRMPTAQVTSVEFGGKNLEKIFVTTARIPVDDEFINEEAGKTYIIYNSGTTGCPGHRYIP